MKQFEKQQNSLMPLVMWGVLLSLAFFQPGLGVISLLSAFVLGRRFSETRRSSSGFLCLIFYMGFYVLSCLYVLPWLHQYTSSWARWQPVWGALLLAVILSACFWVQGRTHNWLLRKKNYGASFDLVTGFRHRRLLLAGHEQSGNGGVVNERRALTGVYEKLA